MLIPHPKEGRHHIDLSPCLVGDMTRTQSQIQVLDEKQNVRGELDAFAKANSGRIFSRNRHEEGSYLGSVSVPGKRKNI